jgi:hypothetical protein
MLKRLSFTLTAVILALTTLGASALTGFAKSSASNSASTTVDVTSGHSIAATLGRNGIIITNSPYTGEFELSRMRSSVGDHLRGTDAKFVNGILTLTVKNSSPLQRALSIKSATGYVYFDLTKNEQALWNSKELAIYGYNSNTQSWTSLTTRMVSAGATGYGRLVAPVAKFSAFALGTSTPTTSSTSS